jgi:hypothetical protein
MLSKFFRRPFVDPDLKEANFQEVSLCQNIKRRETILFNDKREEITLIDQRNYSINSLHFKQKLATLQLEQDNSTTS